MLDGWYAFTMKKLTQSYGGGLQTYDELVILHHLGAGQSITEKPMIKNEADRYRELRT
jgi:hypothetical protein